MCVVLEEHRCRNLCDLSLCHFLRFILLCNRLSLFRLILRSLEKRNRCGQSTFWEKIGTPRDLHSRVLRRNHLLRDGEFSRLFLLSHISFLINLNKLRYRKNTEGTASVVCVSTFQVRSANCWTEQRRGLYVLSVFPVSPLSF